MVTNPSAQSQSQPPRPGHETRDVNAGWIFALVFLLFVVGIAIHFILAGLSNVFSRKSPPTDRWQPVAGATNIPASWVPRLPALQVNPPLDLEAFRQREDAQLNGYDWVNKTSGIVHIPIARAMDLLLEKGLPIRNGTNDRVGPANLELQQQRALQIQPKPGTQP